MKRAVCLILTLCIAMQYCVVSSAAAADDLHSSNLYYVDEYYENAFDPEILYALKMVDESNIAVKIVKKILHFRII